MSGLKIVAKDVHGNITEDVCPDGYIRVIEKLIYAPADERSDFVNPPGAHGKPAIEAARADLLQGLMAMDDAVDCVITTLDKDWAISSDNCRINIEKDKNLDGDKHTNHVNRMARHTLPMPPDPPLTSLHYLDEYILALTALVNQGRLDEARKFLYGVMMMTKCR